MSFFSDLKVAIKELPTFIYLASTNTPYKPLYEDTNILDIRLVYRLFFGERYPQDIYVGQTPIKAHQNMEDGDTKWLFVNGICTDTTGLTNNCLELSSLFDTPIYPIHNITEGIMRDLMECLFGRTFNKTQEVSNIAYLSVVNSLRDHDKVILMGHSQGGIICSNVVKLLHRFNPELVDRLEVYTFASAHDEFVHDGSEHFVNELDYVARTGAINYEKDCKGTLHNALGIKGHMLNKHYLCNFKHKIYCKGESKLYSYLVDKNKSS